MTTHLAGSEEGVPEQVRRRHFPLWEELAVLTAHDGRCVYCLAPSQVKDHVVPFSRGGDDDLRNLTPACNACNETKGYRTPLEFAVLTLHPGAWGLGGHPGKGRLRDELDDLRRRYEVWMERIEFTQVELLNPRRLAWFKHDTSHTYFNAPTTPTVRVKAAICRALGMARVAAKAEAAGWPTDSLPPFRVIRPRKWGQPLAEDPDDWHRVL
ncbi:HNH endonuclease signature motif containing protein [Streptomyces sp. NPDC045470]|uniref:HNH endonuclease n=1 Tax=Streptomyces sp. NPDC045470 TaxID=3155469 RepID=UPI0033DC7FEF